MAWPASAPSRGTRVTANQHPSQRHESWCLTEPIIRLMKTWKSIKNIMNHWSEKHPTKIVVSLFPGVSTAQNTISTSINMPCLKISFLMWPGTSQVMDMSTKVVRREVLAMTIITTGRPWTLFTGRLLDLFILSFLRHTNRLWKSMVALERILEHFLVYHSTLVHGWRLKYWCYMNHMVMQGFLASSMHRYHEHYNNNRLLFQRQ